MTIPVSSQFFVNDLTLRVLLQTGLPHTSQVAHKHFVAYLQ